MRAFVFLISLTTMMSALAQDWGNPPLGSSDWRRDRVSNVVAMGELAATYCEGVAINRGKVRMLLDTSGIRSVDNIPKNILERYRAGFEKDTISACEYAWMRLGGDNGELMSGEERLLRRVARNSF